MWSGIAVRFRNSKRPPIDGYDLASHQTGVQLGRVVAILVLLDGSEPEPRRPATALKAAIIVIVLGRSQDVIANKAPHMKPSAAIALPYIVHGWVTHGF